MYERSTFIESKPHLRLRVFTREDDNLRTSSKLMNLSGWRVGWIYGPKVIIDACNTFHSYASFSTPTPLQAGVSDALNDICDHANPGEGVTPDENAESSPERQSPRLRPHRLWFNRLSSRRWLLPRRFGQKHQIYRRRRHSILQKLAREGAKVSAVPMTPFYNPAKGDQPYRFSQVCHM